MSTSLLLAKVLAGTVTVGGSLAVGAFGLHQALTSVSTTGEGTGGQGLGSALSQSAPPRLSVVSVKTTTLSFSSQLTVDNTDQPYKCRLKNQSPEDSPSVCKLVELPITHNWIDLTGIKHAKQTTTLSLDNLKNPAKQFKLEVSDTLFGKLQSRNEPAVEIVSETDLTVVHAELSTLFKVDGNTVDYYSVSTLLGRAVSAYATIPSDSTKTIQCPLTSGTTPSTSHACTFKSFGTAAASLTGAGYSKVTDWSFDAADSTSLTANNYYFVNYSTPLEKSSLSTLSTVYANEVDGSASPEQKTTLDNVVPVIFNGSDAHKKAYILSETPAYSVVVKKTDPIASGKTLTHNSTAKNYQCKLATGNAVNCNLVPLPFDASSKTSLTLSEVKAATLDTGLTINTSTATPVFYKLEVDSTFFANFTSGTLSSTTINVVELKDGAVESTPMFTLEPLFSISDDDSLHFDKSTFIVKSADLTASSTPTGTLTEGKKTYCSFSKGDKGGEDAKACSLVDLGSSIDQKQNFLGEPIINAVEADKYYLVKFAPSDEPGLDKAAKASNDFFVFEEGTDNEVSNRQQIAKFAVADVEAAIIVEGESSAKFAFRLA